MLNSHSYYICSEDESETEGTEEVAELGEKNAEEDVKSGAESEGGEGTKMERYVSSVCDNRRIILYSCIVI